MDQEEAPSRDQRTRGDSENTSNVGQLGSDSQQVRLNLDEVLEILGWADGEFTAVCHRRVGGQFASSVVKSVDASALVASLSDKECVWFSGNPTAGPERHNRRRGNERAVARWAGIPLDLDVKDGAFPNLLKAAEFVGVLSELIGTRPSVEIFSGHGLQPIWVIEDGELDDEVKWSRAYRLIRRFGRLAATVAKSHCGAKLDNVSDLSRILRVPGTTNWKDPSHPADVLATYGGGGPLADMDCVEEFLDEWAAPEIDSDSPVSGDIISAPEGWEFGTTNCRYVIEMVVPWDQESDRPKAGRHQWAMNRAVRLASAYRLGCLTQEGLVASLEHLEKALTQWCQKVGDPRPLHHDEIGSAFRWAQAKVATFTDERVRTELGDHSHGGSWATAGKNRADFWELTDTLRHIRDFARARRVSPWAMLGVGLARVVATVPPSVQIPPLVGGRASLNLNIGLVGESGKGKGAPERAAKDAFRMKRIYSTGIGSGEGINHLFAHYDKQAGTVMDRHSVLFSVPEIDTLAALGQRNASTLLPQLRKAWSGEALSFAYAARDKALVIPEHSYRLTLVAGIQPGRAGALLDDVDGGTPQRFVWLPCTDPDAPDEMPPEPEPIDLAGISEGWTPHGCADLATQFAPHDIALPEDALALVDRARVAVLRGESTASALDGHLLLCRIKVAVALALLHNCREVTQQFWEMSEVVMAVSQQTRRGVEAELAERTEQRNRARGRAEGVRAVEADTVREDAAVKRVAQTILRRVEKLGGSGGRSAVREGVAHRDRPCFDAALDRLMDAGQVDVGQAGRGLTIRLTGGR
jgi:hypothetical protein